MSEPFLGELRLVPYNFAPRGWAACNGQVLSITQNTALFSLLGTTYGGNGVTTFNLPDLRSRVPIHYGQGPGLSPYILGQAGGEEAVTLNANQMPEHNHMIEASNAIGTQMSPNGGVLASAKKLKRYAPDIDGQTTMDQNMVSQTGGSEPHDNLPPYLVLQWIIALEGIFPSRN